MEKSITSELLKALRPELNEAVKDVAAKHGLNIVFGNAKFDSTSATFTVNLSFAASEDFDPAKAAWDANCSLPWIGLDKEDYGKIFSFPGETQKYRITGFNVNAKKNPIVIQRLPDGKEFVTSPLEIRTALGRVVATKVPSPSGSETDDPSAIANRRKSEWIMNCWRWGMKAEDFGKETVINGTLYRIVGCKPSARKNGIIVKSTKTHGKEYVASGEDVKAGLKS